MMRTGKMALWLLMATVLVVGCQRRSPTGPAQEGERAGAASGAVAQEQEEAGPPSAAAIAWGKIDAGALLIDVRTRPEFDAGHLEGAINIPLDRITTGIGGAAADTDAEIVLYCRTGRRSGIAAESLQALGYRNVFNAGGYEDLMNARR